MSEEPETKQYAVSYLLPEEITVTQMISADDVGTIVSLWKKERSNKETIVVCKEDGTIAIFEAVDVLAVHIKEIKRPEDEEI